MAIVVLLVGGGAGSLYWWVHNPADVPVASERWPPETARTGAPDLQSTDHADAGPAAAAGKATEPTPVTPPAAAPAPAGPQGTAELPLPPADVPTTPKVANAAEAPAAGALPPHAQAPPTDADSGAAAREDPAALRARADGGDTEAMVELARRLFRGTGMPPDRVEAANWLLRAAEAGHKLAQFNIGVLYERGFAVPERGFAIDADLARAANWYALAAARGVLIAQHNLAILYRAGTGVARDSALALALLRETAREGLAISMLTLGEMYQEGEGVPRDRAEALGWYQRALETELRQTPQGSALSQMLTERIAKLQKSLPGKDRRQADRATTDDNPPAGTPGESTPIADAAAERVERIRETQRLLAQLGLYGGPLDGKAGGATRAAIRTFEQQSGMAATGEPSPALPPALRQAVSARSAAAAPAPVRAEQPSPLPADWPTERRSQIEAIQKLLQDAGVYKGRIDGRTGPGTRGAVREAERRAGMAESGEVSPELYVVLRREADVRRDTAPPPTPQPRERPDPPAAPSATATASPQPEVPQPAVPASPRVDPPAVQRRQQIETVQRLLQGLALYTGAIDGTMGRGTRGAIREFERRVGAPETGEPSAELIATLQRQTRETLPPAREARPAAAPEALPAAAPVRQEAQIARTQELLQGLGYYDGSIDGRVTTNLRVAVIAFQKDAGLPETGELTAATLDALHRRVGSRGR
jgi:peptidoglycan hydrolase-like protein with peptidoglycan-binding domain/TPR repeat protein